MPVPFQVIYTVVDDSGDTATTAVDVPTTFSLAQFTEFGVGMAELIDAIMGGVITNAGLRINVDLSALTANTTTPDADAEEIGDFQFLTADGYPVDVRVPCIEEALEAANSDDLDQGQAAIAAFITAMEDGIAVTGGTIAPCDRGEDDIVATVYARSELRNSGKSR